MFDDESWSTFIYYPHAPTPLERGGSDLGHGALHLWGPPRGPFLGLGLPVSRLLPLQVSSPTLVLVAVRRCLNSNHRCTTHKQSDGRPADRAGLLPRAGEVRQLGGAGGAGGGTRQPLQEVSEALRSKRMCLIPRAGYLLTSLISLSTPRPSSTATATGATCLGPRCARRT